jgi:hypothetical protein
MLRMDGVVGWGKVFSFKFQDSSPGQRQVRAPGLHLASNLKLSPNLLTSIATLGGVVGKFLRVERK